MLSLESPKYSLVNTNYVYGIAIKSQFTQLSIDIFLFEMAKLRAVYISPEVKNSYFHSTFLKLKISAFMKDPTLKLLLPIPDNSQEGRVSQIVYSGLGYYIMKCYKYFENK